MKDLLSCISKQHPIMKPLFNSFGWEGIAKFVEVLNFSISIEEYVLDLDVIKNQTGSNIRGAEKLLPMFQQTLDKLLLKFPESFGKVSGNFDQSLPELEGQNPIKTVNRIENEENAHIYNSLLNNSICLGSAEGETEKSPSPKRKFKKTDNGFSLPEDWEPSEKSIQWAKENYPAVDLKNQTLLFKNHFLDKPNVKRPGWDRSWISWITRGQTEFSTGRNNVTNIQAGIPQTNSLDAYKRLSPKQKWEELFKYERASDAKWLSGNRYMQMDQVKFDGESYCYNGTALSPDFLYPDFTMPKQEVANA